MFERIRLVAEIDAQLRRLPQASGSLSAATFAPREVMRSAAAATGGAGGDQRQAETAVRRAAPIRLGRPGRRCEKSGGSASASAASTTSTMPQFTETLRSQIDPLLKTPLGEEQPGVELTITGTAPIVFRARRSLLDGMLFGLGTDVVLIVIAVMVTTRSWLTGGVMFVLSVFPTTLVFGAMGLLGIVVDIGSVMTPCVAVGVTVDDVIHFLLCHRRGVQQGMSVQQAARLGLPRPAGAP